MTIRPLLVFVLALAPALLFAGRPQYHWRDTALWDRSIAHTLDFFDQHAWDEKSGSYASEIAPPHRHVAHGLRARARRPDRAREAARALHAHEDDAH
jgi:hypothetical protein